MITAYSVGMRVEGLPSRLSRHWNQVRQASTLRKPESMPSWSRFATRVGAVLDHKAARRDAWHRDVRLERVGTRADGLAGDHVKDQATAERHVQPPGQAGENRVLLDIQLEPRE